MYSYFFFSCVTIKCLSFCFILDSLRHVSDLYFALLVSPPIMCTSRQQAPHKSTFSNATKPKLYCLQYGLDAEQYCI